MKTTKIIWSMVLFLLIGCTAVTTTEEAEETAVPPESESINQETEEPPVIGTPETEPTPTEDDEDKQVSEPVTVDLSDVTPVPLEETTPIVQPAPGNPGLKEPVIQAMLDLSARVSADMDDIELVSLLEVTWRDGSIGCPEPGVAYTQALVPGQQLILEANGVEYHYHSGKDGIFKYCGDPVPPLESMPINPLEPIPGQDD